MFSKGFSLLELNHKKVGRFSNLGTHILSNVFFPRCLKYLNEREVFSLYMNRGLVRDLGLEYIPMVKRLGPSDLNCIWLIFIFSKLHAWRVTRSVMDHSHDWSQISWLARGETGLGHWLGHGIFESRKVLGVVTDHKIIQPVMVVTDHKIYDQSRLRPMCEQYRT